MTKHKVFISYYHHDDEKYKIQFEKLFGDLFINKSVEPGDINSDNKDEYIKRLIRENYISDSSVIIVLIGPKTLCRKHVDWEIYAGLYKNAGLVGLILPEHINYGEKNYQIGTMPKRFEDNLKSKYAKVWDWTENRNQIKNIIEKTFVNRNPKLKNNSRKQMQRNRCD